MARANKKHSRRLRVKAWLIVAVLGAAVIAVALAVATIAADWWRRVSAGGGPSWLASALRSRGFLTHAIITIAAVVLLATICGMLVHAGRLVRRARTAGARSGQDGVAMIEFALVLPVALILVLFMAQSALLMVGHLCVHYSAYCAARAAIVYVPLGKRSSSWEDRNVVLTGPSSLKLRAIRDAAVWAILPVAGASNRLPENYNVALIEGIEELLYMYDREPPHWVQNLLARKFYYANEYTNVWLDPPENGPAYGENEILNAHVEHVFYMSIPYANRVYSLVSGGDGKKLNFGPDEYGMVIHASSILTNEGVQDYIEPEEYPQ